MIIIIFDNLREGVLELQTDIAIIGAGPQALTLTTHLLQKGQRKSPLFVVLDPSGTWMQRWQQQFMAQDIPYLRSPAAHHPDPNPVALRTFAESRPQELFPPYDRPGRQLFQDFCQTVIQQWSLQDRVMAAEVVQIEPIQQQRHRFRLWLKDGRCLLVRRVVLAGGDGALNVPGWVRSLQEDYPAERLCHSVQVNLSQLQLRGEQILIVGGGLTSGHLAIGAVRREAKVKLMARRQFQEKLFDADPGWMGPKYLKGFCAEPDWHQRWQMIQTARNGGSLTPEMMVQLRRARRDKTVELAENCQIEWVRWQSGRWQVQCTDGDDFECDRIWYATGRGLDASRHPLLQEVQRYFSTEIVNGLPVLDPHLRWLGCELFVMGGLAALQVGPFSRNLRGAKIASDRIVEALTKPTVALSRAVA
ncbi:SidA/IucD/PvdA family monooxygenase [Synechococcales cyanobacterium C]|uniref:SidA/IucD/PvdA family monooxygenase n=1 Tax=Petrachloros mirabilis ULC683 TaxID=2781853 RepID=A0A8K2A113_9CYAN|nr:FAD/NAD(P)-binding protein [Petrachloros mirabilis]NCJ07813.1 SidA/IucD/PvdA family monooxygenase [Petrachloros mirabilis ULC683]